jgi:hypothetical protein
LDTINIIGTTASFIGLLISIWLIRVATGARKAAQEARDYVYKRNLIEDFKEIENIITQLEHELHNGSKTFLQYLTIQSLKKIRYFRSRWSYEISGRANVAMITQELDNLSRQLSTCQNTALTQIEIKDIEIVVSKINQYLYEELGILDKKFS